MTQKKIIGLGLLFLSMVATYGMIFVSILRKMEGVGQFSEKGIWWASVLFAITLSLFILFAFICFLAGEGLPLNRIAIGVYPVLQLTIKDGRIYAILAMCKGQRFICNRFYNLPAENLVRNNFHKNSIEPNDHGCLTVFGTANGCLGFHLEAKTNFL